MSAPRPIADNRKLAQPMRDAGSFAPFAILRTQIGYESGRRAEFRGPHPVRGEWRKGRSAQSVDRFA